MTSFQEFKLPMNLRESIDALGFEKPTEIQSRSIPSLIDGKDLLGRAKTGSGKTAAFMIPVLAKIINKRGEALILVPTRELALQIEDVGRQLIPQNAGIGIVAIIGGGSMHMQTKALKLNPSIIVATPGRLIDHLMQKNLTLEKVHTLVLDEADRMLDMGFFPQIKRVVDKLPTERQTLLFSATFPKDVKKMAQSLLKSPVEVIVGDADARPAETISQDMIETTQEGKRDILLDELDRREGSVLIFTRTKHRVDRVAKFLQQVGHNAGRLHGDRSLAQRKRAIDEFRSGESRILVATDIAARGLDISRVAHVINFDLPQNAEDYIHRIGRTGRAGAEGQALSLVTPEDRQQWKYISRNFVQ